MPWANPAVTRTRTLTPTPTLTLTLTLALTLTLTLTLSLTKGTTGAATLAYKAPEAFDDEFTTASEVYAFGILAWEVLTAKVPWEGYTLAKLTKAIIKEERPPLPPQGDFQLVKSCWAQEPQPQP